MADMELIIKIPEKAYQLLKNEGVDWLGAEHILNAVANGTPLPKGHGDLVTKEQMIEIVEFYQLNPQHFDFVNLIDEIKDEKPIIEADKEQKDGNT